MNKTKGQAKFRRILLKFSGEALGGKQGRGIDTAVIKHIANEIKPVLALAVQVGIIIGGGNFFRGREFNSDLDHITVDHMGMMATIINALAMREVFEKTNIPTEIMSAVQVKGIVDGFDRHKANSLLAENTTVIFTGGTGNPLVTTDTALSLRGIELGADLLLKATNVDGIYSHNPKTHAEAKLYHHLTYQEVVAKELQVMDLAAFCMCRDHHMRLRVFNWQKSGALLRIVLGEEEGTLVE